MDSASMQLKVMYSKDLKAFNFFQKLIVYVLVSIVSDDPAKELKKKQQQRTPADKEGDGNPEWNHEMRFDLNEVSFKDCDHVFIHFDLCHEGLYFGDKTIGEVRVPLKDLINESHGFVRFLSYEVRTHDGKPNGVLNFSSKVDGVRTNSQTTAVITGYTIDHHHHQTPDLIQYPAIELESSLPGVQNPLLDSEFIRQEPCSVPQVHYPSQETQYSSQEHCYPPLDVCYPPLPLPPVQLLHQPPPPPWLPMVHGACFQPPHPPLAHPWVPAVSNHSMHGTWSPIAGQSPTLGNGEMWSNDFRAGRDPHSPFWNGR